MLFFVSACQQSDSNHSTESLPINNNQKSLTFIVHPYDNPSKLVARFTPLCDYLGQILGQPVKLVIARSYVDQIQRISKGQADLAYMGPTPFLRAQDRYLLNSADQLIPIVAEEKAGEASYQSVIIVQKKSSIKSLQDLHNRTLALGAPHSFSSHYVPRVLIGNKGIAFNHLRDFAFLGSHERVALAVLHGDFDAGGLNLEVATRYQNRPPGLRILAKSPPLPPHLIVARPKFDEQFVDSIQIGLLNSDNKKNAYYQATQALGDGIGFAKVNMDAFDRARRIIQVIESTPAVLQTW